MTLYVHHVEVRDAEVAVSLALLHLVVLQRRPLRERVDAEHLPTATPPGPALRLVTPRYAPLRPVTPRYAPLRPVTPRYAPLRPVTPRYAPLRPVTPRYAPLRPVTPRYATSHHIRGAATHRLEYDMHSVITLLWKMMSVF